MYKNLPKYKKELLNLAKGVIKHLLNPPHSYKVVEIRGEFLDVHPLQWLKTASSMIVELSPALKRRKYSEGIKYVNELESVLKEIKSHGSVKQFQDKSKKTYNNFLKSLSVSIILLENPHSLSYQERIRQNFWLSTCVWVKSKIELLSL